MARTLLTRELIEQLDEKILVENHTTKEELKNDLQDYKIMLDHTYGGTIRWYKLPFLKRVDNKLQELNLTRKSLGTGVVAVGIIAAITIGGMHYVMRHGSIPFPTTDQISLALTNGDYDTCNSYVSHAMTELSNMAQAAENETQRNYYQGLLGEMEALRVEINRSYSEYEEAKALGIDSSSALSAYKAAFMEFAEKAAAVGIQYVEPELPLDNEGPKLG